MPGPRFEMGSAWVEVHADTAHLRPEVNRAADQASRSATVTVDVKADEAKLERLGRKAEQVGTNATKAFLAQERAQIAVNRAQERYDALLKDETTSQDDRTLALNRVRQAQLQLEEATRRGNQAEQERTQILRDQDTIRARQRVVVDKDVDRDVDRTNKRLTGAFDGIGERIGGVLQKAIGGALEAGVETGMNAFKNLTNAGVSAGTAIGTALVQGVSTTAATGGINLLIGAVLALAFAVPMVTFAFLALAPALQIAAGGFGAAIGGAIALASILGTLKLAFGGAMEAISAYGAMQDETTDGGARMASQARSNAIAIRNAQESIGDARKRQAQVAQQSAEQIRAAEERVTAANERTTEAQRKLNDERIEAKRRIEDLAAASSRAAISQERADLRLAEAKKRLADIDAGLATGEYSGMDRRAALLDIKEAQLDLAEAKKKNTEATRDATKAAKDGVEGDKQVLAAKRDLRDAHKAEDEAERNLKRTKEQAAAAQEDANVAVARAVRALSDLKAQQAEQARMSNQGSAAAQKYAKAMGELTPAGRAFVRQVVSMRDMLDKLKATAQDATLPGVTRFLKDAGTLFPVVNRHIGNMGRIIGGVFDRLGDWLNTPEFRDQLTRIFGSVERFTDNIGKSVTNLLPALMTIADASGPILERFGKWLERITDKFAKWIDDSKNSGALKKFFDDTAKTFDRLWTVGGLVWDIITDVIDILFGPSKDTSGTVLDGVIILLQQVKKWLLNDENKKKVQEFWDDLKAFGKWLITELIPWVRDTAKTVKEWIDRFKGWADKVEDFRRKVREKFLAIKNTITDTIDGVKSKWDAGWKWVKDKATTWTDRIKDGVTGLKDHFVGVFKAIPGALASPLNSVIGFLNGAIDKINVVLPKNIPHIPTVSAPGGGAGGAVGRAAGAIGRLLRRAGGGPIYGPGSGTSDQVPILASNGEFVVREAAVRKLGLPFMHRVNQADRDVSSDADMPRFANGGEVNGASRGYGWQMAVLRRVFPGLDMISGPRPGARTLSGSRSLHSQGLAVDLPPIRRVAEWIARTFGGATKELITPWRDLMLYNGRPHKFSHAVEAQHGVFGSNAHIHWGWTGGGRGGFLGGVIGAIGGITKAAIRTAVNAAFAPMQGLVNRIMPQGVAGDTVRGVAGMAKDGISDAALRMATFDTGGRLLPGYTLAYNGTGKAETIRTAEQEAAISAGQGGGDVIIDGDIHLHVEVDELDDLKTIIKKLPQVKRARTAANGRR